MPHVVIKAIKGATPEQVKQAAEQIAEIINKTMGKPKKYISVSYEEYASFDDWKKVYDDHQGQRQRNRQARLRP